MLLNTAKDDGQLPNYMTPVEMLYFMDCKML